MLFLLCIFGWLVFMMIIKWITHYDDPNTVREGRGSGTGKRDKGVWKSLIVEKWLPFPLGTQLADHTDQHVLGVHQGSQ